MKIVSKFLMMYTKQIHKNILVIRLTVDYKCRKVGRMIIGKEASLPPLQ